MNEELEAYQIVSYCGDCLIAQKSYNCGSCGDSNKMKDIELTEAQFESWLSIEKHNLNDPDDLDQCIVDDHLVTEAEEELKGIRISHQRQLDSLAKAQLGADGTARYLAEATQKLARAKAKQ
jgi:hypothetical protein